MSEMLTTTGRSMTDKYSDGHQERIAQLLFPTRSPLGSLQWVNPDFDNFDLRFSMRGEITNAQTPFCIGIHVRVTKSTSTRFDDSLTSFTFFIYRQERPIDEFCRITRLHIANS